MGKNAPKNVKKMRNVFPLLLYDPGGWSHSTLQFASWGESISLQAARYKICLSRVSTARTFGGKINWRDKSQRKRSPNLLTNLQQNKIKKKVWFRSSLRGEVDFDAPNFRSASWSLSSKLLCRTSLWHEWRSDYLSAPDGSGPGSRRSASPPANQRLTGRAPSKPHRAGRLPGWRKTGMGNEHPQKGNGCIPKCTMFSLRRTCDKHRRGDVMKPIAKQQQKWMKNSPLHRQEWRMLHDNTYVQRKGVLVVLAWLGQSFEGVLGKGHMP